MSVPKRANYQYRYGAAHYRYVLVPILELTSVLFLITIFSEVQ